jgi:hypothetical protein
MSPNKDEFYKSIEKKKIKGKKQKEWFKIKII